MERWRWENTYNEDEIIRMHNNFLYFITFFDKLVPELRNAIQLN